MNRGDLVIVREAGTVASKPRPCVVVQRDSTIAGSSKLTVCPLTSRIGGKASARPLIAPSPENGLRKPSEVQIDWITTHPLEAIGPRVGSLDGDAMRAIDRAIRRWLSL